jgi:hypothetical protein
MCAMVFDRYGPDVLCPRNVPVPEPQDGFPELKVCRERGCCL